MENNLLELDFELLDEVQGTSPEVRAAFGKAISLVHKDGLSLKDAFIETGFIDKFLDFKLNNQ